MDPGGRCARSDACRHRTIGDPAAADTATPRSSDLPRLLEPIGRLRQHRAENRHLQMQTLIGRIAPDLLPVFEAVAVRVEGILQEHGIEFQPRGIVDQLEIVPAHRAEAVSIETDGNRDRCRVWRQRRGNQARQLRRPSRRRGKYGVSQAELQPAMLSHASQEVCWRKLFTSVSLMCGSPGATLLSLPAFIHFSSSSTIANR